VALIAPWDPSFDERAWKPLSLARRKQVGLAAFDDVDGRLAGATAASLTDEIMRKGPKLDLTRLAEPLAKERLLVITAARDSDDDQAAGLLSEMHRLGAEGLTTESLDTDHGFNSRRITLQSVILRWLERL
jgi:hypothetical protein